MVSTLPGEQHEIGSLITALFLRRAGYTVHYLGPNTPLADLRSFAERTGAKAVVLSAAQPVSLESLPHEACATWPPWWWWGAGLQPTTPTWWSGWARIIWATIPVS